MSRRLMSATFSDNQSGNFRFAKAAHTAHTNGYHHRRGILLLLRVPQSPRASLIRRGMSVRRPTIPSRAFLCPSSQINPYGAQIAFVSH